VPAETDRKVHGNGRSLLVLPVCGSSAAEIRARAPAVQGNKVSLRAYRSRALAARAGRPVRAKR